ncbi:MAG: 2OG-Fe(II) oxygenase [Nitrosomonadales bacterium]|nr:2OG-Fe(II) oxygenase [Nitrosomonadales bacterium]
MTIIDSNTNTANLLKEIEQHGYVVIDNFLPGATIQALSTQAKALQQAGSMRQAGVGKTAPNQIIGKVRGDSIYWLDANGENPEQKIYLERMQDLQTHLNRHFFLGLFEFETHFAIYPPGGVYHKHLDQFKGQQERQVSAILYLNDGWQHEDGGALRLYLGGTADQSHLDIAPIGGRMIVFLSGKFFHEVLPATRERISLTGWFRTRSKDLP